MARQGDGQVWKLVLAYDGADFHGWQVQPQRVTIQGELRAAIAHVTGEDVLPQGSGRTDAGVHAAGQVASFSLAAPVPERNLGRALNRILPAAIRVLSAQHAPIGFHARHSAKAKVYEYCIFRGEICPPFLARYCHALDRPLDFEAMRRAARRVLGQHDFTSFAASGAEETERGNIRTIYDSEWLHGGFMGNAIPPVMERPDADLAAGLLPCHERDLLTYRVRGDGFLHHMVRNLVGTFLDVGRGNLGEEEVGRVLEERARASAGPTAPACGLCLVAVEY
jgi:tRNA pseudouridine38-40 synthase